MSESENRSFTVHTKGRMIAFLILIEETLQNFFKLCQTFSSCIKQAVYIDFSINYHTQNFPSKAYCTYFKEEPFSHAIQNLI